MATSSSRCTRILCTTVAIALAAATLPCAAASAASRPSRSGATSSSAIQWSIDLDCSTCHATEFALLKPAEPAAADAAIPSKSDIAEPVGTGHEGYAAQHVADFGLTCVSCHEDSDKLADAHKKLDSGKEATRLKKTSVSQELCLGCHNADDLAKATADSTTLTDDNGTVINPHDIPEGSEHGTLVCTDCHKVHEQEKTLDQTAKTTCTSCHHAGVFECGTCH